MTKRQRVFFRWFQHWWLVVVVLVGLGVLVSVLVDEASLSRSALLSGRREASMYGDPDTLVVGSWEFASAHVNVGALQSNRQRLLGFDASLLLMVAQNALPSLVLLLPLLGGFIALVLMQLGPPRAWPLVFLAAAVPLTIGAFLACQVRSLNLETSWSQWSRVLVWLGFVGLYFDAFLLLGRWISRHTRSTKTAAWILLSLFVALFLVQSSRPLLMRMDGSALPPVPGLPTEVRLSLFRPSGEPRVTLDRVEMVDAYLASVDGYSEAVHTVVARRYALERWWDIASPQLLLIEISTQLLQTDHADIVDVVYSASSGSPSVGASCRAIWPEAVWLVVLCIAFATGSWMTGRRRARSP